MKLLLILIGSFGGAAGVIIFLVLNPDKIEVWAASWWKILSNTYRGAHKKYVKHDLQGRVNGFTRNLRKKCPELHQAKLRLEWIDATETREAFIADGKVVIRLRRDDPEDHNFVHGIYYYVSTVFLHRAKTYLTKTQRISIDIFTCTKFIESQKAEVIDYFLTKYLHPITAERKSKITALITRLETLYEADLYFPVFIQEMQFLGYKIFGRRLDHLIHKEVSATLDILETFSNRKVGDDTDSEYLGAYCKFAIVIVGRAIIVQATLEPYVHYLEGLIDEGYESIYLLGPAENNKKLESVCLRLDTKLNVHRQISLKQTTRTDEGERKIKACLFVIRSKNVSIIQPPD